MAASTSRARASGERDASDQGNVSPGAATAGESPGVPPARGASDASVATASARVKGRWERRSRLMRTVLDEERSSHERRPRDGGQRPRWLEASDVEVCDLRYVKWLKGN